MVHVMNGWPDEARRIGKAYWGRSLALEMIREGKSVLMVMRGSNPHYVVTQEGVKAMKPVSELKGIHSGTGPGPMDIARRLTAAAVGFKPKMKERKREADLGLDDLRGYYEGTVDDYGPMTKAQQDWLTRKGAYGSTIKMKDR